MPVLEAELTAVMDALPYGLYIIGSRTPDGDGNGTMADWLTQVSFRPRLLTVSIENTAQTLANIRATGAFSVNLLGQDPAGMELARGFAQPFQDAKISGRARPGRAGIHRKLEGIPYATTALGSPVLAAAIGWVDCEAKQFVEAGDHTLVLGHVVNGRLVNDAEPLTSTYTGWLYSG